MIMRIFVFVVLFTAVIFGVVAQNSDYPYSPITDRDPLYSLINEKGEINVREDNTEIGDIFLQGIIYSPGGGSMVIINKEMFNEGDNFEGYIIKKIEPNGIFLEKGEEEYFLKWEE